MANKLVNVNGKFVMQRDTPTSPSRLGPTKIKEALNKTAQQKKAAQGSGSVPYASPIAKNVTMDTSPRNYGKPVTEKVQIVDYQSPIDTSPRNYGRPVTNKPHFGLYDDEKSLSNVTLGDVTYKPLLSGYYGQKMNEAIGVNRLAGNTNMNTPQIAKYQGLTQKYEPTRFNNPNAPFGGLLNNAPQGAMSLIGQQGANLTDEDTVMYAGTGAAAGAMAGSVAGLPGSAISAATGFGAGIAAGVGKNMFEAVYGGTYRDLMDAGVSDSTAHKTALISAGVQSALEMAQLDELAKAAKLLRKQNKTVLAEGIEKILIDRGKGVLKNTGEEMAQEAVAMGFEYDAKKAEGLPTDSWQDNVKRAVETGLNSALSIGLISLPGAVSARRQINSYNGKLNSMDKAVGIANKIKRESDIKNPEFTGPFMQPQTAEPQIAQFTPDENVKNVLASKFKSTEDVKKWAENLAQKSKFDIEFVADADASYNGYFKPYAPGESNGKQGRMVVNLHSEDPIKTVFGHELTHILEANSKDYNEYANFAINNLVNRHYGTTDITALAEQKAASYAQRGVNLSIDEAKQEIVAELTGEYLFKDEQSITDLYRYNENLFYRIYENIKKMIKSFAGTDEEKDLIKARNLYAKVLKANQKNPGVVQTAQEGDTQAAASYLFAGENAKNADKEALAKAQQMESDNADAETIWKETGWFRGPDKKWRWEIDDSKGEYYQGNAEPLTRLKAEKERYDELFDKFWDSELTKDEEQEMESLWELLKENDIDPKETGTMGDFYKNDDMYAAYPNLKYVGVRSEKMDPNGMYIPDEDTIAISKDITDLGNKDRNKSVLLHETQHAIQRREGFSKGGNLDVAKQYINSAKKEYEQLSKQKDDMFQKMLDGMPEDTGLDSQGNVDDKLMAEAEKLFDEKYAEATSEITKRMQELENKFGKNIGTSQYDAYRNFAGEIEAREVQNRQNMTAQERREKLPDLGGKEAIVKFSMKDSTGKQLSQKQQEFFKDSKVRDENGSLLVMYHGTPHGEFEAFDAYGGNFGLFGQGIYTTDELSVAIGYSNKKVRGKDAKPHVYKLYVNIENPINMDEKADSKLWNKKLKDYNMDDIKITDSMTNTDAWNEVLDYLADGFTSQSEAESTAGDLIRGMGYDGITHQGGIRIGNKKHRVFIAFEPEQIKTIDNDNPTEDVRMKFSLRELPKVTAHPFLEDDLWSEQTEKRKEAIIELIRENPRFSIDNKIIVGYSPKEPGRYQVTYLDKNGEPLGDSQRDFDDLVMDIQIMRDKDVDVVDDYKVPDVKFSLKEPVETTKDLIAAHNLSIDNMMKTLNLGGLPAASIAVAKADMGHNEFGEISVLFYPDTIDGKKNKANKVFAGDAWTQTFPQILQKVSKQAHERLEKRINSLLAGDDKYKDLGYLNLSYDGVQGEIDRWDSFERAYRNSYLMKLAYLRDTGKEFKPVMMEKTFIEDKPVMKAVLQIIGADKAKEWMDKDEMMSYEPKIREAINKYYESVSPGMTRYDKPMTWAEMDRTVNSLRQYAYYIEDGSPKVIDTRKTEAKFDKAVNMKAYTKWLESISKDLIEKQGVRNSKDLYTNNGRRSWDQLYDEPTLENITKAMTSKDLTGNSFSGGTKFVAGVKKQLGSISDIKKNKDLIKDVSDEEIKAIRDDIDKRLIELVDTVSGNNNDSLFARNGVIDSLLDVALKGKTRDGIKHRLMATQYGNIDKSKLTDKVVDDFVQLIQDAQAVPTRYFEAKPQRAIGLDEIAMVVIPRKGTKELRAALDARGINYKMYDGTAEDRIAKINGVPDVKFSLKKTDAKNIARKIKADYGSKSTIKDIAQELTEIYDMDVNDMMAVNQRIEDLAARIADNVPTVNEFEPRIKEFKQAVRNMPIRVDDNIKTDIADFGTWSKRYFNRLNLSADGRNIDELYSSLAEQFPEFLESDIDNPTDQLMAIAEALDTTRQDKGYSNNEDMMYDILLDIYDDYYRYQVDEQAKADEGPEMEPGDDGPGNNGPTDDGDAYGDYDGDTSLARIDVWEHTEPEDRSPYFEKGENPARDINVPQRDEYGRKVSRFTRTAAESRALDDKQASELNESVWNGTFSYNVITDQDAINRANDKMERFDNDTLLNGLESKLYDSKIITKDDIALGERLIQEYAKEKNVDSLERAIAVVATAGTRAGQAVQAMRLLKKLSPAGQLMALQKQIDVINTDMKLLGDNKVTLSPERASDITSSDTPEGLEQAVERAKMELYNKVPSRWVDKWNAWRYLSMLGNPKTHIRNVLGNAIFVPVRGMKNVIGASIEAATVKGERSKAIGKLPKVFKEFAAKEFDANREVIDAGGKENIERNKRVFKSSLLEGMRKANSFALEAEDQKFLKAAYVRSFAGYLKANKISPALVQKLMSGKGTDIEIGDAATAKIFNNARAYAMNEAQKATYRDYSALANALNKFKKTNAVTTVLGEGLMPFTKTPINILKRGVEYSPVGILKGIKELTNDVRKADDDMKQQTILKGIDSMASGLSGTAILALGAFLASQGILSGGGEDDKKERDMAAMMGSQNYSFNIGDVSYTVDWMAPVSLPLFVGVELFNSLESKTVNGFVDIVDAMTSISEPMVNMSMLQGLNRAVTNYDQKDALTSTATEMALGYFSQGVPTLSGQIARTMDATRRTAYVDKNNDIPDTLERPMLNAAAKVPGLSKKLNPYRDSFGRAQTNDSTLMRAFENFISPGYVKVKKNDMVLNELQKVYGRTGDNGVLPSLPNKKIGDKNLTAKEYDRMAYIKGKQSYDLINTMRRSDAYKDLSAADQAKMISDAYDYAYAMAKDDVLGVKPDGWIAKAAEAEKKHDIPVGMYITYNNYKSSLKGEGTKAKFIDKIQSDDSLTQKQKDKLDDYWYGSIEASKITELSNAEQRQWNVAKEYGFDEEKFSKYVGYITQQGEGKTKMNNINDAVKAGLPRGEAVLLYNIMRQKKYRYNG